MFKSLPDPLWHASVLEGLATIPVLDAWASGTGLVINTSPSGVRALTRTPRRTVPPRILG
jgi:hypothetical protein